jgi:hypothetical protein
MLAEAIHAMGFVATCAPHQTMSGNVYDSASDLLYAGPMPWSPSVLDVGRDDYYGHSNAGCPDLARSVFLEPLPASATKPPGW